jgi:hypothetical protein
MQDDPENLQPSLSSHSTQVGDYSIYLHTYPIMPLPNSVIGIAVWVCIL